MFSTSKDTSILGTILKTTFSARKEKTFSYESYKAYIARPQTIYWTVTVFAFITFLCWLNDGPQS